MLSRMSWSQFLEWMAYFEEDPFGEERADWRSGMIASVIANVNRNPKKGRAFTAQDFMPKMGSSARAAKGERKPLTDPGAWAAVKQMASAVY